MICSTCYGKRWFFYLGKLLPCPECEARGEVHCCEGLQEQPEAADTAAADREATPDHAEAS